MSYPSSTSGKDRRDESACSRNMELGVPEHNDSFDFVMIEADDGALDEIMIPDHDDSDDDDDDSYDYCEDACPMLSDDLGVDDDNSLSGSLIDMKDDAILTVPEILMKDLEEAHASAKLVQIDDSASPDHDESMATSPSKAGQYSSASSVVSVENEQEKSTTSSPTKKMVESAVLLSSFHLEEEETQQPGSANRTGKAESVVDSTANFSMGTTTPSTSISRTSNKKRRKRLKMMKKAQAAACAAQHLAEKQREMAAATSASSSKQQAGTAKKATKSSRYSSKKVANIAVACATETMAAYRKELLVRGIK
ncbi:MAG: hypothetical protein SGARI_004003 [Bacillariaceae sp.]